MTYCERTELLQHLHNKNLTINKNFNLTCYTYCTKIALPDGANLYGRADVPQCSSTERAGALADIIGSKLQYTQLLASQLGHCHLVRLGV